jgi:DNA-binding FadR family transcriptional regulator
MFKPVSRNCIYEDILEQIEHAIHLGALRIGDKLPGDRELQEIFKASRTPLREALKALARNGLIEIKKGARGGAYVRAIDVDFVAENLDRLIRQHQVPMSKLEEFRVVVEGAAGGLAAERANAHDIEQLKELLNRLKGYASTPPLKYQQFHDLERKLHLAIARISNNQLYQWVLSTIHTNISLYYGALAGENISYINEVIDDWDQIIQGVEKRESAKVQSDLQAHVVRSSRYLERKAREIGLLTPDGRLRQIG